jgi:predicted RNA methylase
MAIPQTSLFGRAGVGQTRDPLDRFFTPLPLARVICQALRDRLQLSPRLVLEPSVGGGNFVRAARETWPGCYVFGVDIDPEAEGLELCDEHMVADWLEFGPGMTPASFDLSLGNPPFTGKTAIDPG